MLKKQINPNALNKPLDVSPEILKFPSVIIGIISKKIIIFITDLIVMFEILDALIKNIRIKDE